MTIEKKSYKGTIHLPKTDFPMKANLPQVEPERVREWEKVRLYERIRQKSLGKPKYILHDGPPYANGNIHAGHALNKILKDIIVKFKTMSGFDTHFVPGWDCHGMPIEHAIFKTLGKRKEDVNHLEFRKKARQYAQKYIQIQREEFKRLGVFGDWEKPYLTMDYEYQTNITESFLSLFKKGYIEQRLKPVPWCYDCETALADAELEYEDKISTAVFVALEIIESHQAANQKVRCLAKENPSYVIIWTTTPWTLPANVAIAFHPKLFYLVFEAGESRKVFVAAENLVPSLKSKFGLKEVKPLGKVSGKELEGIQVKRLFGAGESCGILADFVSATDGSGVVHIAPGHGEEDYQVGFLEHHLEIKSPVDEKGRFTSEFKEAEGILVHQANRKIIELLRDKKVLLFQEDYPHSYPHCWRCKNPIIFRATDQWFLKVDHHDLRQHLEKAIAEKIQFIPSWGKNRIGSMVETRPDWCLSRQRLWGVPIPIIRCKHCGKVFVSETEEIILDSFKKQGADVWFEKETAYFFGGRPIPSCCSSPDVQKEEDIIDVWFDSGVSHQAVLKNGKFGLVFPADLYLEGSDQHRGWFQSALISGMALEGKPPFKSVLTHGFVVDGEGKKMSKSAGNVVAPQDVMREYGADILRLWVASCDYSQDIRLSKEILERMADAYRKIRNTFRYLLANLHDFDPSSNLLSVDCLDPVDQYIWARARELLRKMKEGYEQFDFDRSFQNAYVLCNVYLSSYYLDIVKDRLYTAGKNSETRRSVQTAMFLVARDLVKLLAPTIPFTAEAVWHSIKLEPGVESVHEACWSDWLFEKSEEPWEKPILSEWEIIHSAHKVLLVSLEEKRMKGEIAASLDAKTTLHVREKAAFDILKKYEAKLRFYFIISQFILRHDPKQEESFRTETSHADGSKCVRCWNYSTLVGSVPDHPDLCERCLEVVAAL